MKHLILPHATCYLHHVHSSKQQSRYQDACLGLHCWDYTGSSQRWVYANTKTLLDPSPSPNIVARETYIIPFVGSNKQTALASVQVASLQNDPSWSFATLTYWSCPSPTQTTNQQILELSTATHNSNSTCPFPP